MIHQFWMICRTPSHHGSKTEPRQRYSTADEAARAAQDMADQTGHPLTILAAAQTIHPKGAQQSMF